jgi:hypothetical protein
MKRLKVLFSLVLLVFALPFWRFIDLLAIVSPFEWPTAYALMFWFALFIAIPVKLLIPKIKSHTLVGLVLFFGALAFWASPQSKMSSREPDFNHCGSFTYTGVVYPLRGILTDAHHDDLEARNQLCWIRKLISKVPERFDNKAEVDTYNKIIQDRLLRAEIKYRASLPLIAFLYIRINSAGGDHVGVKAIYDSIHFWVNHYTEEIRSRSYSSWSWPHSDYIQWEYGLIEKNWQKLIDNILVE